MSEQHRNAEISYINFSNDTVLDQQYIRDNDARGELRIDRMTGAITLLLRWKYRWMKRWDVKNDWTDVEKEYFHVNFNFAISKVWNDRIFISVTGTSDLAKKFIGRSLPFSIEIIQVNYDEHWNVVVFKLNNNDPNSFNKSYILWNSRYIELDSKDTVFATKCLGSSKICRQQLGAAHELGHVIGYPLDEYYSEDSDKSITPHSSDADALMNIGMELRTRYMQNIIERLNRVNPGSIFSVKSIENEKNT